ncbi:hypothetical protein [Geminisphaera colitermitum]|uniref:hypothetical protein n=1 Tax=Geminisphaera colitermitum TaxID=1148786 RepID=UPI000158C4FB|nr:hypothetical protein [Geminisphaera colitermitum]
MSIPRTIKQKSIDVPLTDAPRIGLEEGTIITVRRMAWNPFRDFLHEFGAHFGSALLMFASGNGEKIIAAVPEMILNTGVLLNSLLIGSTDLTPEKVGKLDPVDALDLVKAACEIHGGDELKNSWAGAKASVVNLAVAAGLIQRTTNNGVSFMPFLSKPATAPTTSTAAPSGTST